MVTFFPGPSQVYPQIKQYLQDAFDDGILSISHRSETFNKISKGAIDLMHEKLSIPSDYTILFTSSATESWEIIAQSFTKRQSVHFYSGSFGEKWFQYAKAIHPNSRGLSMPVQAELVVDKMLIDSDDDLICLTQNETSNGTQIDFDAIVALRTAFPEQLIAYDGTSSLAGIHLPIAMGDIWFASVQKCFGLPAGLGILILSPKAVLRAKEINDRSFYNSALTLLDHIQKFQTSCTPNVLAIYLLGRVMENALPIDAVDLKLRNRMRAYQSLFLGSEFKPLVSNEHMQSVTVLTLEGEPSAIEKIKEKAKTQGILLGSGYGNWKSTTFRIANFPAHTDAQVDQLIQFFKGIL